MTYEITITTAQLVEHFCGPDRGEAEAVEALEEALVETYGGLSEEAVRDWIAADIDNGNIAVGVDDRGNDVYDSYLVEHEVDWAADQIWSLYQYHLLDAATAAPS